MAKNQRLPKGFRYLFTTKEVKAIAAAAGTTFSSIRTGNISTAEHLQADSFFQGSFRGPTIDAYRISDEWQFSIHQTGFREELFLLNLRTPSKWKYEQILLPSCIAC